VADAVLKASKARAAIDRFCAPKKDRKGDDKSLAKLCDTENDALRALVKLDAQTLSDVQLIASYGRVKIETNKALPEWSDGNFAELLVAAISRWVDRISRTDAGGRAKETFVAG
jgi:hypothetical protein